MGVRKLSGNAQVGEKYSTSEAFCYSRHFEIATENCYALTDEQHLEMMMVRRAYEEHSDGGPCVGLLTMKTTPM